MIGVWCQSSTNKTLLVVMYEVTIVSPRSDCNGSEKVQLTARSSSGAKEIAMYYGWKVIGNPKKI